MPTKKTTTKKSSAADVVDEQLARYRDMRHFNITTEPVGRSTKATSKRGSMQWPFVIQKHAASHLHYDFRLGWNGVLKSWAVAKGPSYNVKDRRLAVQVEDHPMEYGGFEGIIPKGQYGGGTVMVWDQGTWSPQPGHEDIDAGLREGSLKIEMHGTKMHGKWTLIRMHEKPDSKWGKNGKPNWLLIKEHDDFERGPDDPAITEAEPNSAVTGRSLEQIATQEDHVWNSKETRTAGQAWFRNEPSTAKNTSAADNSKSATKTSAGGEAPYQRGATPLVTPPAKTQRAVSPTYNASLTKLPKEPQPDFLPPQLALEATTPPANPGWLHELKLDGYRIQARKSGNEIKLLTRKGLDWTHRMPPVAEALARLPAPQATLDGEVVVLAPNGTTSFADLQAWFQNSDPATLTYFAFDLLHLDGHNTRNLPLLERKAILADIITPIESENLKLSEHLDTDGEAMFHKACELHAEGILSKRADAPYTAGRTSSWLKSKCLREQEFIIAGFTDSTEGTDRIGSLLLAYYEGKNLIYAGRTGTGFTQKLKRELRTTLNKLETKTLPFAKKPADVRSDVHWVKPKLVAQVRFATWTADNLVRQAAFLGLREDKPATEVRREEPTIAPKPKADGKNKMERHPENKIERHPEPSAKDLRISSGTNAKSRTLTVPTALRLTHPDKILDPATQLTKRELAEFYWAIAPHMLPHIAGRPLSLVRCPEGAAKPCFFQKHVNKTLPPGIGTVQVPDKKTGVPEPYITIDNPESLAALAQMSVLELHPWGSRNDDLEHPDRLILDLDPDASIPWPTLAAAAADVRSRLKKLGLTSFLKVTGGKGLHIVAPIAPTLTWPELKDAAHNFVLAMERSNPGLYLTKMSKAARAGKIYLDYLRNERGATAVAPYSPRAREGMHVSLPLPWSALKESQLPTFAVKDFASWRDRLRTDPWKSLLSTAQTLSPDKLKFT